MVNGGQDGAITSESLQSLDRSLSDLQSQWREGHSGKARGTTDDGDDDAFINHLSIFGPNGATRRNEPFTHVDCLPPLPRSAPIFTDSRVSSILHEYRVACLSCTRTRDGTDLPSTVYRHAEKPGETEPGLGAGRNGTLQVSVLHKDTREQRR